MARAELSPVALGDGELRVAELLVARAHAWARGVSRSRRARPRREHVSLRVLRHDSWGEVHAESLDPIGLGRLSARGWRQPRSAPDLALPGGPTRHRICRLWSDAPR